jgi:hypothetical protein
MIQYLNQDQFCKLWKGGGVSASNAIVDMIQYLNQDQFCKLWKGGGVSASNAIIERIDYWNNQYRARYKLKYYESSVYPTYWGAIEGDEKDINWFLLSL